MLVEACLRGDRSAFDELVESYESTLFNAAYRITGSVDDAMDATQTAFVNAYEKLHTYDPSHRFFRHCNSSFDLLRVCSKNKFATHARYVYRLLI